MYRNPTIEDQALARIHRIGQEQEVTTVRLYVRDSFEEASLRSLLYLTIIKLTHMDKQNVVENQQAKRDLAGILLSGASVSDVSHLEASYTTSYYELLLTLIAASSTHLNIHYSLN